MGGVVPLFRGFGQEARAATRRFPFPIGAAFLLTASWCLWAWVEFENEAGVLIDFLLVGSLGLPWLLAGTLLREALEGSNFRSLRWLPEAAVLAGIGLFAFSLPEDYARLPGDVWNRWFSLVLGGHFLVAFALAAGDSDEGRFWRRAVALFLRAVLGVLYAGILFVGLVLAVVSLTGLFAIEYPETETYGTLFGLCFGLFQTLFVLGGIPRPGLAGDPEWLRSYPRVLRFPCQFILAPLAALFLAILYAYAGKILVLFRWPEGLVALPVLLLGAGGILLALLVFPLRGEERWAEIVWRWFFRLLAPLTLLLVFAFHVRIEEYGVTILRWHGLALGLWLLVVAGFFAIRPRGRIRWLPAGLAALAVFSSVGPWDANAWSFRSQKERLVALAEETGRIDEAGTLVPAESFVPAGKAKEMESILRYLIATRGGDRLGGLLAEFRRETDPDTTSPYALSRQTLDWLGIHRFGRSEYLRARREAIDATGYGRLVRVRLEDGISEKSLPAGERGTLAIRLDGMRIEIAREDGGPGSADLDLWPLFRASLEGGEEDFGAEGFPRVEGEAGDLSVGVAIEWARVERGDGASPREQWTVSMAQAWVLLP